CIKKSDDMGSSDFDPFSEIVKRSVLTDRHYPQGAFFMSVFGILSCRDSLSRILYPGQQG
ncbi:hypothetical protein, partial [Shewanella chilikensis]|uniref:hypothetical protein n=1 Tax=Shewanella chilikensis TaxID=558541 RepID=UPI0039997E4D